MNLKYQEASSNKVMLCWHSFQLSEVYVLVNISKNMLTQFLNMNRLLSFSTCTFQKCWLKRAMHSESWEEYQHMMYERTTMKVDPFMDDGTTCPACKFKLPSGILNRFSNSLIV